MTDKATILLVKRVYLDEIRKKEIPRPRRVYLAYMTAGRGILFKVGR